MEKNKTGKYFKYAIGEIILVVIGILIALQINNWNETKKKTIETRNVLLEIKEDLIYLINGHHRIAILSVLGYKTIKLVKKTYFEKIFEKIGLL